MQMTVVKKTADITYGITEGVIAIPAGTVLVEIGTENWCGLTVPDPPSATILAFCLDRQWIFFSHIRGI